MLAQLLLAPPAMLVLLAAPAVLSPNIARAAPLCDTRSIRRASLRCDLGSSSRRAALSRSAAAGASALAAAIAPSAVQAAITKDSEWPLWLALPVAPYSRRKTIRREIGPGVWAFEQLLGIYYVYVPIRMTVVRMESGGLFVYAPVAPTRECLALLQPLIDAHGEVRRIVCPSRRTSTPTPPQLPIAPRFTPTPTPTQSCTRPGEVHRPAFGRGRAQGQRWALCARIPGSGVLRSRPAILLPGAWDLVGPVRVVVLLPGAWAPCVLCGHCTCCADTACVAVRVLCVQRVSTAWARREHGVCCSPVPLSPSLPSPSLPPPLSYHPHQPHHPHPTSCRCHRSSSVCLGGRNRCRAAARRAGASCGRESLNTRCKQTRA